MYKELYEVTIWRETGLGQVTGFIIEASDKFEAVRKAEKLFIEGWVGARTDEENLQRQTLLADAWIKSHAEHRLLIQKYLKDLGYYSTCTGSIEGFTEA